jgi:hypothetical protein
VSREFTWLALPILAVAGSAVWQARVNARLERGLEQLLTRLEHPRGPVSAPEQCVTSLDPTQLRQEVSRALSGICPSSMAQIPLMPPPTVSSSATSSAEDKSRTKAGKNDEAIKAFDEANSLIDGAIARHTWSPEDVKALHGIMPALDARDRGDVVRRIVQAVNAQQLSITGERHVLF